MPVRHEIARSTNITWLHGNAGFWIARDLGEPRLM
jgi:hypothetical protein